MASTIALVLNIAILGIVFFLGASLGLSSLKNMKREKKENFLKENSPTTILIDTIGAIILREADKVECKTRCGRFVDDLINYTYTFNYNNVDVTIEAHKFESYRYAKDVVIDNVYFSVGTKENIQLKAEEQKKLLNYITDALDIKTAKLEAEKEKQRQLDACDALENLMNPAAPQIPVDDSGVTLGTTHIIGSTSTTSTSYFIKTND